jgi:hypothetical protein
LNKKSWKLLCIAKVVSIEALAFLPQPVPSMFPGQLALITAALFTGAATYVNVAEHPARMMLEDRSLLVQWKPAYTRGAAMQASLAAIGFLLGLLAWWQSGHWLWLAGAAAIIAPWLWTLLVIMPVNDRLQSMDAARDGPASRPLLERWGTLHAMRTALGFAAIALYLLALVR